MNELKECWAILKLQDPMKISDIKETIEALSKQRKVGRPSEYNFVDLNKILK